MLTTSRHLPVMGDISKVDEKMSAASREALTAVFKAQFAATTNLSASMAATSTEFAFDRAIIIYFIAAARKAPVILLNRF